MPQSLDQFSQIFTASGNIVFFGGVADLVFRKNIGEVLSAAVPLSRKEL